jgi:hypothetical protein
MHPGPMNRGVEISSEVADGAQSLIKEPKEPFIRSRWSRSIMTMSTPSSPLRMSVKTSTPKRAGSRG